MLRAFKVTWDGMLDQPVFVASVSAGKARMRSATILMDAYGMTAKEAIASLKVVRAKELDKYVEAEGRVINIPQGGEE